MGGFTVAVVGATGLVGREMVSILEERDFPVRELRLLASERSAGEVLEFHGTAVKVGMLRGEEDFRGVDIALFSAGAEVSRRFAPLAAGAGAVVIDNSSAWRMDPEVPLIVPEVNPHALPLCRRKGIIANPNCSTIQMVVALKPIHEAAHIERIVVATYQSVSGTGKRALDELLDQVRAILSFGEVTPQVYPHQIAFNVLPHIDAFLDNGYTREEMKMINETRKILEEPHLGVTATTVRVPVFVGHSEAVNVTTSRKISAQEAREILSRAPGVKVVDDPARNLYPLPLEAAGKDEVFVGRIREDPSQERGLDLWVVADNLRKGAALNAVQIAELLRDRA